MANSPGYECFRRRGSFVGAGVLSGEFCLGYDCCLGVGVLSGEFCLGGGPGVGVLSGEFCLGGGLGVGVLSRRGSFVGGVLSRRGARRGSSVSAWEFCLGMLSGRRGRGRRVSGRGRWEEGEGSSCLGGARHESDGGHGRGARHESDGGCGRGGGSRRSEGSEGSKVQIIGSVLKK